MKLSTLSALALSLAYWVVAVAFAYLAVFAPCGLVPGAWCELEGPNLLGAVLGMLGPVGTLLIAALLYFGMVWLIRRQRKSH